MNGGISWPHVVRPVTRSSVVNWGTRTWFSFDELLGSIFLLWGTAMLYSSHLRNCYVLFFVHFTSKS